MCAAEGAGCDVGMHRAVTAPAFAGVGVATAGILTLLGVALGGCSMDSSALGVGNTGIAAVNAVPISTRENWKMAALAPMLGAPDTVKAQLAQQITSEALKRGIVIRADQGVALDYTLHGYFLVETANTKPGAKDKAKSKAKPAAKPAGAAKMPAGEAKIVYVWDVMDRQGKRVNRVAGEEFVGAAAATGDGWSALTPAMLAIIADKGVTCIAAMASAVPGTGPASIGGPHATAGVKQD